MTRDLLLNIAAGALDFSLFGLRDLHWLPGLAWVGAFVAVSVWWMFLVALLLGAFVLLFKINPFWGSLPQLTIFLKASKHQLLCFGVVWWQWKLGGMKDMGLGLKK